MKNFRKSGKSKILIQFIAIGLILSSVLQAQPGRRRGPVIVSPEIMPDNSVTFRLNAPDATTVTVLGEAMVKSDSGIWTLTTDPMEPEQYDYTFRVDGVTALDPGNAQVNRNGSRYSNYFIIPGERADLYKVNDVPHGSLAKVWYDSPVLEMSRRLYVYTPPGYEGGTEKYPVFYLLHGAGGDEDNWSTLGQAVNIMDNLIAQGKAKPMIVVMTNGNANQQAAQNDVPTAQGGFGRNSGKFEESVVKDVVPFIDRSYRTYTDRENRAIAGLSMGGGHSTYVGLRNIDKFAWVGAFSGAFVLWPSPNIRSAEGVQGLNLETVENEIFPGLDASANDQLNLLYISIGTEDFLFDANTQFKGWLTDKGINFVEVVTPGYGHVWPYWRISLVDFAQRVFQ